MNGVDDAVFGKEPDFVAPFFWVTVCVCGVVVVDEMGVEDIILEGRMERSVCLISWQRHYDYLLLND